MKKVLAIILMALAVTALFVSCDDPKHEHSYDATKWEKDGTSHWHVCTTCSEKVEVATHTLETTGAKEPTCTESGYKYESCSICGYSTKKEKAATGHKLVYKQNDGGDKHYQKCENAKCTYKTDEVNHEYSKTWSKDETKHWHECVCGKHDNDENHTYGEPTVEDGKTVQSCSKCGDKKNATDATIKVSSLEALQTAAKAEGVKTIEVEKAIAVTATTELDLNGKIITLAEGASISMSGEGVTITIKNFSEEQSKWVDISGAQAILGDKTECVYYTSLNAAIEAADNSAVIVPTAITLTADNQITVDKALKLVIYAGINGIENIKLGANGVINLDTSVNLSGCFGGAVAKIGDSSTTSSGAYYPSIANAVNGAKDGNTITLITDAELDKSVYLAKSVSVDMNNKKLTVKNIGKDYNAFYLKANESAYTVTFKNGTILTDPNNTLRINHAFSVDNNAVLNLDDVDIDVKAYTCVYLVMESNPSTLTITNGSNLYNSYGYGIGTNATNAVNTHVNLTIKDSKINDVTGKGVGETGLMVNVPCTVSIENSTIAGDCHGIIFRSTDISSSVEVKNSTIRSVSSKAYNYVWGGGNNAPQAALTIGNSKDKDRGYPRGTKVVLTDVTLECGNPSNGKHLWVEQATTTNKTEVSGTVKVGESVTLTHNDNINGATVTDLKCNGEQIWK